MGLTYCSCYLMDGVTLFCLYLESSINRLLLEERRQRFVRFSTTIDFERGPWSTFALCQLISMLRRFSADGSGITASIRWQIGGLWYQTKALSDSPVVGLGRNAGHWGGESSSTRAACLYAQSVLRSMDTRKSPIVGVSG